VIGRNQNPWRECRVEQLEKDGGYLARRLSGGGAVYHDMGNLNFSFITHDTEYNLSRQYDVVIAAMNKLGLKVELGGRNDILINGRKFSGNAYIHKNGHNCHHGTILVDTDKVNMERYLSVSPSKLQSKGVSSIPSRIVNLREIISELTVDDVKLELLESFAEIYRSTPHRIETSILSHSDLSSLRDRFASRAWRFGQPIEFTVSVNRRFDWGEIEIQLYVKGAIIQGANIFSDALNTGLIEALSVVLAGVSLKDESIVRALSKIALRDDQARQMVFDICEFIRSEVLAAI
jgi:lipoate-protein ligase A